MAAGERGCCSGGCIFFWPPSVVLTSSIRRPCECPAIARCCCSADQRASARAVKPRLCLVLFAAWSCQSSSSRRALSFPAWAAVRLKHAACWTERSLEWVTRPEYRVFGGNMAWNALTCAALLQDKMHMQTRLSRPSQSQCPDGSHFAQQASSPLSRSNDMRVAWFSNTLVLTVEGTRPHKNQRKRSSSLLYGSCKRQTETTVVTSKKRDSDACHPPASAGSIHSSQSAAPASPRARKTPATRRALERPAPALALG